MEISEDTKKKYTEACKNTSVDCEKDNARKKEVEKVVKPLIGKVDGKTAIIDIPEVKDVIKDAYVCWGCLAEVCMQRQKVSMKTIHKKLVNKFCINQKLLIGNQNEIIANSKYQR